MLLLTVLLVVLVTVATGFEMVFGAMELLAIVDVVDGGAAADVNAVDVVANGVTLDAGADIVAAALVTVCDRTTAGFSHTFDGGIDRALLLTFGSICRISTSGSLTSAPINMEACLVASAEPLIVIIRSFCDLPCFSTSM